VTTVIQFTTSRHINQRLSLLSSAFRTALPGRWIFTSVFLAPCWTLDCGTLLTLSAAQSVIPLRESFANWIGNTLSNSWVLSFICVSRQEFWRWRTQNWMVLSIRWIWFVLNLFLYRQNGRLLSAKFVRTFADRGCRVVSPTDPQGRILGFLDRSR
jgi:hypothetical protein